MTAYLVLGQQRAAVCQLLNVGRHAAADAGLQQRCEGTFDTLHPLGWLCCACAVVTRLIPKLKWTHAWWGRLYIISMLWATGA